MKYFDFTKLKPRAAVFIVFLLLLVGALPARAVEYGGFGGRPANPDPSNPRTSSIFVYTLNPGETKKDAVTVINNSQETKDLLVYATDSTPSTGGAYACEQFAEEKNDVGAWIQISKPEVKLASQQNETVPFTVKIPASAAVGEHDGCIFIQEKKNSGSGGGSGVNLSVRTGLRVVITVPGDIIRNLEIVGMTMSKDKGNFVLHPQVKNTGNVSIDADVKAVTRHIFGGVLAVAGGEYPVLRGQTSDWNFVLPKSFFGGLYHSTFTVTYDQNQGAGVGVKTGKELTELTGKSIWFWAWPSPLGWLCDLVIIGAIIAVVVWCRRRKKHKAWMKNEWVEYTVKKGESIKVLSEKFGVSWKVLAKANGLRPPYTLEDGDIIKVPPED